MVTGKERIYACELWSGQNFQALGRSDDGLGGDAQEEAVFDNTGLLANGLGQLAGFSDGTEVAVEDVVAFVGDKGFVVFQTQDNVGTE